MILEISTLNTLTSQFTCIHYLEINEKLSLEPVLLTSIIRVTSLKKNLFPQNLHLEEKNHFSMLLLENDPK